jgi:hypothetical protein
VKTPEQIERNRRLQAGRNAKRKERAMLKRLEEQRRAARRAPSASAADAIALYRLTRDSRLEDRRRQLDAVMDAARAELERQTRDVGFLARSRAYRVASVVPVRQEHAE